jgi:hypothetical protein
MISKNKIYKHFANPDFFKIDNFVMKYHDEINKEVEANEPIYLNPFNWDEHKETFYNQRIVSYKDKGYKTEEKKINSEKRKIENLPNENKKYFALLPNENEKYILLKEHYRDFLNEKLKSKEGNPKRTKKQIEFEDFFKNITAKQIKNIKEDFKDLEPKETAIFIDLLYNDFKVLNIIPGSRKGKSQKDFIKHITDNSNQSINMLFSKDTIENYIYKGNEADKTTNKKTTSINLKQKLKVESS